LQLTIESEDADDSPWKLRLKGPEKSLYKGANIKFEIHKGEQFPFKPPRVVFKPALYHPLIV